MGKIRYCSRCEQRVVMYKTNYRIWYHAEDWRCPVTNTRFISHHHTTTEVGEDLPLEMKSDG